MLLNYSDQKDRKTEENVEKFTKITFDFCVYFGQTG